MLSPQDNELLTRSGRGTPMGEFLRRFWMPALLSEELPRPDGEPRHVTLMGEQLLAFRTTDGTVGLVDPVCPHRGADLWFGRNEEGGLRCAYHGWKFDATGRCLDAPTAPPELRMHERIRIAAYPTREWGGIVWAYLGPVEAMPPLPMLEFGLLPPAQRFVTKKWQDCNWVQCAEGALDTAHFSFLHRVIAADAASAVGMMKHAAIGAQAVRNDRVRWVMDDPRPVYEVDESPVGLVLGGVRKADGDERYWRIAQYLLPTHAYAPNAFPGEPFHGQTFAPATDTGCWIYTYSWNPERPYTEEELASFRGGHSVHAQVDADYMPLRGRHNRYLIDRDEQRRASYTGIRGVSEQDAAIQDSQGAIADRTREHLTPTDAGLVRFRRLMLEGARALAQGVEPAAVRRPQAYAVRSGGWVAHRDKPLAVVMQERFGHRTGWAGERYGLTDDGLGPAPAHDATQGATAASRDATPGARDVGANAPAQAPSGAARRAALGALLAAVAAGVLLAGAPSSARAQAWPSRPLKIVVPYPPGGIGDMTGRALGQALGERLGQPVIVENRPGASQIIAADAVAKSPPDGYTLFFGSLSSLVLNVAAHKQLPYDPRRDFTPVSLYFNTPLYLVVNPALPVHTVTDLVRYGKANPGKLSFGSIGTGSSLHLTAELFRNATGVEATHVPYKGSVPAVTDLISGQIQFMFDAGTSSLPHVQAGKLRVLAVSSAARAEGTPDIPTVAEAGVPGFEASFWFGIVAPAGTPAPIVQRLAREIGEICRQPAMRERFKPAGVELVGSTPEQMAERIRLDFERWPAIQRAAGVQPE